MSDDTKDLDPNDVHTHAILVEVDLLTDLIMDRLHGVRCRPQALATAFARLAVITAAGYCHLPKDAIRQLLLSVLDDVNLEAVTKVTSGETTVVVSDQGKTH